MGRKRRIWVSAFKKCDFEIRLLELFMRDRVIASVSLKTL